MSEPRDEFYVGYLPMPAGHMRFVRVAVPLTLWVLVACSAAIAYFQRSPGDAVWDQSKPIQRTGTLRERPYPHLVFESEGATPVFLVEKGKRGTARRFQGFDGKIVRVTGWRLERDGREIVELESEAKAVEVLQGDAPKPPAVRELGTAALSGEVVDYKCYLGAMKPGDGKAHKACAALCIAGGIPPMLVMTGADGTRQYVLLATSNGGPWAQELAELAGEPVQITGRLREVGTLRMLMFDSDGIKRQAP